MRIPSNPTLWDVVKIVNGGLDLLTNNKGFTFTGATPGVANTEFTITHNLGYIPTGFLVVSIDQAAIVYKGVTAWTATAISLKCNQATANVVVFVF